MAKKKEHKPLFDVPTIQEEEWQGMPEFNQKNRMGVHQIIVHFQTKENIQEFSKLIGRSINQRTKSIWYPHVANKNLKCRVCIDES